MAADTFSREKMSKYMCEFVGVLFLVLFVKLAVTNEAHTTALTIGLGLALLIYTFGTISGAHLNPSVTVALLIRQPAGFDTSNAGMVIMYLLSQYTGGVCGGMLAWFIGRNEAAAKYPTVWQRADTFSDEHLLWQALVAEMLFTFLLCSVVLHTATDPRQSGNNYYGLAIGLSLALGVSCIGPISGCCLNSAVWLGTVVPAVLTHQVQHRINDFWIYWIGTFAGGVVAGLWYNAFHRIADEEAGKTTSSSE